RYRVYNLSLCAVLPGPHEPSNESLQHFLRPFVDDLLRLYLSGVKINTPNHPEGRLVRVALVALICDHPALCKIGGFADQASARWPCTQCQIRRADIPGFASAACRPRSGELHKRRAARHYTLPPDKQDDYTRKYGVRWSEFNRLPYFNPITMCVIDPMHSLLLGKRLRPNFLAGGDNINIVQVYRVACGTRFGSLAVKLIKSSSRTSA
ncbi:hypothetical protein CALCODRAFT_437660, partial [Calocera cornea HHB12733]